MNTGIHDTMTIAEYKAKKEKLETDLLELIFKFQNETKAYVIGITFNPLASTKLRVGAEV